MALRCDSHHTREVSGPVSRDTLTSATPSTPGATDE